MNLKYLIGTLTVLFHFYGLTQQTYAQNKDRIDRKVDSVKQKMTLEEKAGQLNQYSSSWATGPLSEKVDQVQAIRKGQVGSLLNVKGSAKTRALQEVAMQSRIKIPLLFGLDVIHGYKTTFPIPLAEAASWDMQAIEESARIAAKETAASGIHWTFAPMVDITRDPRWGRVMEGAGEDTWLGSAIARARVKGFQGQKLGSTESVMACVKHFAAYGAAIGGRDYNSVDMSSRTLWEYYLPPFKAALDAGAATFMNSFNDLNGIPATGNTYLQRDILKGKWKFSGFVVSDWGSITEMVAHGYVADSKDAAKAAITAGSDMDMEGHTYLANLPALVKEGKVPLKLLDDAVRRVLKKKFELGLFTDPYKFSDTVREQLVLNDPQHRLIARDVAKKSIVLLKNEHEILPLKPALKKIALIGPLAKSETDMLGFWNVEWPDNSDVVSIYEGLSKQMVNSEILYAQGCAVTDTSTAGFAEAIEVAKAADVVVVSVGETRDMSGEAKSRSDIHLPGVQEDLIMALIATGKPVVVLVSAGRPLIFNRTARYAPAILYIWWLGSEAGNAIADVLSGKYNPSGKLPMTFPREVGQIPIYYNYLNTGRPANNVDAIQPYRSGYIDLQKSPAFPFGYGLSYTSFKYEALKLDQSTIIKSRQLQAVFKLTNTGQFTGEEIVQLYLRDRTASIVRPLKELKDFKKVLLAPGESKEISFTIDEDKLSFYNNDLQRGAEAGMFDLMIGASSADIRLNAIFELLPKTGKATSKSR
ncbi:MAG: glycosyl hydrolase [Sphingobacteriaceae bacterium]|nr:MAG: glycosyl hydrolase [Sphingobacteriaceae bacterium]